MKLTREQREKILRLFPKQRGNVKVDNSRFLDALIYICENGCKWRALPETFGPWHTIYVRYSPIGYVYVFFFSHSGFSMVRSRPSGSHGNEPAE
ncbi:MAG: transposase [Treponema sp.]|nr:transposase [Treponema sp.]